MIECNNCMNKALMDWLIVTEVWSHSVVYSLEYQLRLVNGRTRYQGRVEIYYRGRWGTICDDYWDLNDAHVVCRQLGFFRATSSPCCARYGRGSGPIWLKNVHCRGSERSLVQCRYTGWGVSGCGHWEDAGVVCGKYIFDFITIANISTNLVLLV